MRQHLHGRMKMSKILIAVTAALMLGCSMSPEEIALETAKLSSYERVNSQPTITCTQGCTYRDPHRTMVWNNETNGWDVVNKALDVVSTVAVPIVLAREVGKAIGKASEGGNTTISNANVTQENMGNVAEANVSEANQANQANINNEANQANINNEANQANSTVTGSYNPSSTTTSTVDKSKAITDTNTTTDNSKKGT